MAYRFTNTEKWQDNWFSQLSQLEMLLFIYLCDNCDIAGFIEINYKRWANDLNSSITTIQGASKGLRRGLIYSKSNDCIFIRNFLKHQKNYPLNENNKAHLGILRRFDLYKDKFDIQDINEFIQGASKGLQSPSGIGNDIDIGNGDSNDSKSFKKNEIPDFEEFKQYAIENSKDIDLEYLELKYKSWKESGWIDGNGNKIKNWKSKLLNTIPYLHKNSQQQKPQMTNNSNKVDSLWPSRQ